MRVRALVICCTLALSACSRDTESESETTSGSEAGTTSTVSDDLRGNDRCDLGAQFLELERLDDAERAYIGALRRDPDSTCAQRGIREVTKARPAPTNPCIYADALREVDAKDEARKAYLEQLKANPEEECIEKGLAALDRSPWLGRFVIAFAAALAIFLLVRLHKDSVKNWKKARWGWLKRFFAPRLVVGEFGEGGIDTKIGKGFRGMVQSSLTVATADAGADLPLQLDLVSEHEALSDVVGSLAELAPQAKAAAAVVRLVELILPRKQFTLDGELQPPGGRGAGITLSLRDGKRIRAGSTLWLTAPGEDPVLEPPAAFFALAGAAAAWSLAEIGRLIEQESA